jgi:hypothetical protein
LPYARESGPPGGIRTHTSYGLNVVTPADWSTGGWCVERDSTTLDASRSDAIEEGRSRSVALPSRDTVLDRAPLPELGYRRVGPSGWIRTTTSRVKSPACYVHTTKGLELMPSIELGRRPYQGRMLPLHHISVGANGRIRTDTARLGRPAGSRYPTFALVRPTGIEPVPPRWHHGMLPPHSGRTAAGVVAGLLTSFSCQRARSFRTDWWAARESNPASP